jgi:hypothetical protein
VYAYSLTIPVGYTASNLLEQRCKLSAGILSRILITFPPGCLNLVHVVVLYQAHQIEPWNRDGDLHSDDYTFDLACQHEIIEPDTEVTLRGWNDDTDYDHTVDFVFDVSTPPDITAESLLQQLNDALIG